MKNLLIPIALIIIIIVITMISLAAKTTKTVTINGRSFDIDIAKSKDQQEKGLAIYDSLPENKGMVFPFDHSDYYAFWMKDMKFPIDIIYINQNKIVDVFENVPNPKSADSALPIFKPRTPANLVLEINAGLSQKYSFKIGDSITTNF